MERLHKVSAGFVFAFICLHFANHFAGLFGVATHIQFMDAVRLLYRQPIVEWAVLLAFAVQIVTGVPLILEIWRKKKDFIHQLQALSGLLMVLFIVIHVVWVLIGRMYLYLDTNFTYAAAGLMSPPWHYAFMIFYGAGVGSLFVHMGCILYDIYKKTNKAVGWALLLVTAGAGGYVTWLLIMIYSGHFYPVTIPADYQHVFPQAAIAQK